MSENRAFVVLGAGQAGGWAARTLRDEGYDGPIVLIGAERFPPYERPPLSKEVLLGDKPPDSAYLWPEESFAERGIELRTGVRATAIDRAARTVALSDGASLAYHKLLIATGAEVRRLEVPGAELPGVHYLRAIPDTLAIRADIARHRRLLVVGAGWIGLEVAAAARRLGAEVTVIEVGDRVCGRALPVDACTHLLSIHQEHRVDIRLGASLARLEGDKRVARAMLSDGTALDAPAVVVGIGIVPDVALAESAGLEVANGITVDETGRTSDPHIFAAGDVTNHPNPLLGRRIRLESWENAQNQAIAAAKGMLGKGAPYAEIPWFWSDQYDVNIQLVGLPEKWDSTVVRGDPDSGAFVIFYLREGLIEGAVAFNQPRDLRFARRLMAAKKAVEPGQLADPAVKMQALLKG